MVLTLQNKYTIPYRTVPYHTIPYHKWPREWSRREAGVGFVMRSRQLHAGCKFSRKATKTTKWQFKSSWPTSMGYSDQGLCHDYDTSWRRDHWYDFHRHSLYSPNEEPRDARLVAEHQKQKSTDNHDSKRFYDALKVVWTIIIETLNQRQIGSPSVKSQDKHWTRHITLSQRGRIREGNRTSHSWKSPG